MPHHTPSADLIEMKKTLRLNNDDRAIVTRNGESLGSQERMSNCRNILLSSGIFQDEWLKMSTWELKFLLGNKTMITPQYVKAIFTASLRKAIESVQKYSSIPEMSIKTISASFNKDPKKTIILLRSIDRTPKWRTLDKKFRAINLNVETKLLDKAIPRDIVTNFVAKHGKGIKSQKFALWIKPSHYKLYNKTTFETEWQSFSNLPYYSQL